MTEQDSTTEEPAESPEAVESEGSRRLPLILLPLLIVALLMALFIGTNVISVLFAVVAPPSPLQPSGMDQVAHTSESYGVDYWKFTSTADACDVVQYIEDNGGACRVAPLQCGEYRETQGDFNVENNTVARCGGQVAFSIFNMQWWALVMRTPDSKTQLEEGREVYWIGTGPQ